MQMPSCKCSVVSKPQAAPCARPCLVRRVGTTARCCLLLSRHPATSSWWSAAGARLRFSLAKHVVLDVSRLLRDTYDKQPAVCADGCKFITCRDEKPSNRPSFATIVKELQGMATAVRPRRRPASSTTGRADSSSTAGGVSAPTSNASAAPSSAQAVSPGNSAFAAVAEVAPAAPGSGTQMDVPVAAPAAAAVTPTASDAVSSVPVTASATTLTAPLAGDPSAAATEPSQPSA